MKPKKEANRITKIWRHAGPGTYPINLKAVVDEIVNNSSNGDRASVRADRFDQFEGALLPHVNNTRKWVIVLNKGISNIGRRNFTFAHEIGHFIGHRHLKSEFECTREQLHDFSDDELEVEANEFAVQLLMPPDIIRPYVEAEFTFDALNDVTSQLAVSKQAAGLRWIQISKGRPVGFVVSRDGIICWGRTSEPAFRSGIYFKSGTEIPSASLTSESFSKLDDGKRLCDPGIWHSEYGCSEHVYMTSIGDYKYTCLDFTP